MESLFLPIRRNKSHQEGVTVLIDSGCALRYFHDVISSQHDFIEFVKFGWGTAMISRNLMEKIHICQEYGVHFFFGGTLFEKFLSQGKINHYLEFCLEHECRHVEISNGTIDLSNEEKGKYIEKFAAHFTVFSEVGYKNNERSLNLPPSKWVEYIQMDFAAGASKVITEARESGTSGICRSNGEVRFGLIEEIIASDIDLTQLIFEAPTKDLQTYFISRLGANVNLANIHFDDVIPLETLRLGLRSDTLLLFDSKEETPDA